MLANLDIARLLASFQITPFQRGTPHIEELSYCQARFEKRNMEFPIFQANTKWTLLLQLPQHFKHTK